MAIATIRPACATDLENLLALLNLLFTLEEDFDFDADRQRQGLKMMLENDRGILLVAHQKDQIVGMCSGQLMISTAEGGHSLLVEDVVVSEPLQGRGIGTMLLQALQDWGREKNVARLQLLADRANKKGLDFYHERGWHKTRLICLCKRQTI